MGRINHDEEFEAGIREILMCSADTPREMECVKAYLEKFRPAFIETTKALHRAGYSRSEIVNASSVAIACLLKIAIVSK